MKEYNSIYLGIVIQNNDPKKRGRVKVYVPHISPALATDSSSNRNKSFKFINIDLEPDMKELKDTLPWAETAQPLVSENASGRYNSYANSSSVSDTNSFDNFLDPQSSSSGEYYDSALNRLNDEFNSNSKNVNNPNPYSFMYKPNTYANKAKGSFGIPSVGAHVYVFFREGNPNFPVILASAYGISDWQGIYENEVDYPGKFENVGSDSTDFDHNVVTYRNKYVLNQKGGTIEIGNTDFNEKIRLTQYSGSFKEFNNNTNIELATKNDQKLVLADSYDTVKGFRNIYTKKNLDEIILRDKYKKIGNLNRDIFEQWRNLFGEIQDTKQLFPTKRTFNNNKIDELGKVVSRNNSTKQTKSGQHDDFPVFTTNKIFGLDNINTFETSNFASVAQSIAGGGTSVLPTFLDQNFVAATANIIQPGPKEVTPSSEATYEAETGLFIEGGKSPSTANGKFDDDESYQNLKDEMIVQLENLMDLEKQMGLGGNEIIEISKNKIETIGCVMNDYGSIRLDPVGKLISSEMIVGTNGVYTNQEAGPLIEYVDVQDMPGGSYSLNVTNKYNLMVGSGGLSLKSTGPTNIVGSTTNIGGEQVNIGTTNDVNIDGDVVNISANILKLRNKRQRQIFVDSSLGVKNNVIIGGGLHVEGELTVQHITAPTEVQLTNQTSTFGRPSLGPLGIGKVIGFIPQGVTLGTNSGGPLVTATAIGIVTSPLNTVLSQTPGVEVENNSIEIYPHNHTFNNIPLTLTNGNRSVRNSTINSKMSHGCNVPASPAHNTCKGDIEIKLN